MSEESIVEGSKEDSSSEEINIAKNEISLEALNKIDKKHYYKPPHAEFFFYSAGRLLSKRTKIQHEDFWYLNKENEAETLFNQFEQNLKKELEKTDNPSLPKLVLKTIWKDILISVLCVIMFSIFSFAVPLILPHMIVFVQDPSAEWYLGYIYTAAVIVATELSSLFFYRGNWYSSLVGLKCRAILMCAVYNKSLKTSKIDGGGVGKIVNLFAGDSQLIFDGAWMCITGLAAPVPLIGVVIALYFYVGYYCLIALAVFIISFPLATILGKRVGYYRLRMQIIADDRLKRTTELIQGIRIVKYYAWERPFVASINATREREIKEIRSLAIVRSMLLFFIYGTPAIVLSLIFLFYGLYGEGVTPAIAFTVIALVNITRVPFQWMSVGFLIFAMNYGSILRIGDFLSTPNKVQYVDYDGPKGTISIKEGSFRWAPEGPITLDDININIKNKEKVLVVGHVGAGKTSLSMSLLGEPIKVSGEVSLGGSVAYVPQQAWIFNATVRENILFGEEYDEKRYNKVIFASALLPDFDQFAAGDMTEIGERGVNLSGGQRQRISIARALYADKDIYIFDDPLSAVDAHVGSHIFKHVVLEYLKNKTVFMATNQLQYLPKANQVILLEKGKIQGSGNFSDMMNNPKFKDLMDKFGVAEESSEKPTDAKSTQTTKPVKTKEEEAVGDSSKIDSSKGSLIQIEERASGLIPFKIYWYYNKAGGLRWIFFMLVGFVGYATIRVLGTWWLSMWSSEFQRSIANNGTDTDDFDPIYWTWTYVLWLVAEALSIVITATIGLAIFSVRAARNLHVKIIRSVSRAVTAFFDRTPVGRILARLSQDLSLIDFLLSILYVQLFSTCFLILSAVAGIGLGSWYIMLAILPLFIVYFILQRYYRLTNIEIQRLESVSRAPPISLMASTLSGLETIRTYNKENRFMNLVFKAIDYNDQEKFALKYCAVWYGVRLDLIGTLVILAVFLGVSLARNYNPAFIGASAAGVAMSYTAGLTSFLSNLAFISAEVEIRMNSIERFWEYNKIAQEDEEAADSIQPPENWPSDGEIKFENFSFRYRSGPMILNKLNFVIAPKSKVGLVGRTGAGKSSMLQALYRIEEPAGGTIKIDGLDFSQIGLFNLRSSLAIIPQEPALFIGSLRYNLDPFEQYTDDQIWGALKLVQLDKVVGELEGKLEFLVEENGGNFSVGQRQLMCMARALLRNSSILLLDEATASVDIETDALIQTTIRKAFENCTVITIAHRLNTIMDSDKIVVLERGMVVEYDKPINLLKKKSGHLYEMVQATGEASAKYLYKIADGSIKVEESIKIFSKKDKNKKPKKSNNKKKSTK